MIKNNRFIEFMMLPQINLKKLSAEELVQAQHTGFIRTVLSPIRIFTNLSQALAMFASVLAMADPQRLSGLFAYFLLILRQVGISQGTGGWIID